jgi:hypothetical protein
MELLGNVSLEDKDHVFARVIMYGNISDFLTPVTFEFTHEKHTTSFFTVLHSYVSET